MKKLLKSCFICLIIIAMISTTAFAAAPNDLATPQANSYILKTTVAIVALGNGVIEVDCGITGTGRMEKIGTYWIDFYKEDGTHVEGHYYTESGYEYMMGYNAYNHHASVRFQCVPGQRYYAIVYFHAGKGNGSGGFMMGSSVVVAK